MDVEGLSDSVAMPTRQKLAIEPQARLRGEEKDLIFLAKTGQGDDFKEERTCASNSARARRAASASFISTLTNFTGVLG